MHLRALACLLMLLALAAGGAQAVPVRAGVDPSGSIDDPYLVHLDCIGPGVTGTEAGHAAHTEHVRGPPRGGVLQFTLTSRPALTEWGACPASDASATSPQAFTGRYHLVAVCVDEAGRAVTFLDWTIDFVAGHPVASAQEGDACSAQGRFTIDVTVAISGLAGEVGPMAAAGAIAMSVSTPSR